MLRPAGHVRRRPLFLQGPPPQRMDRRPVNERSSRGEPAGATLSSKASGQWQRVAEHQVLLAVEPSDVQVALTRGLLHLPARKLELLLGLGSHRQIAREPEFGMAGRELFLALV